MYRTGDRGRYNAGGEIEFIGRTDDEIKLRGNRIHPAEIRSALLQIPGMSDAAVVLRDMEPGPGLVAYLCSAAPVDEEQVRNYLRERLPDYMLPSRYAQLERLPLTAHGKLDRSQLPLPVAAPREGFVAPRDPVEHEIAELWAKLLGVAQVGIYDDFFRLGGHSLLLVRLAAEIRERFLIEMPLARLFDTPVLADMVDAIALEQLAQSEPHAAVEAMAIAKGGL
jgi:acyl carrier protein